MICVWFSMFIRWNHFDSHSQHHSLPYFETVDFEDIENKRRLAIHERNIVLLNLKFSRSTLPGLSFRHFLLQLFR